MKDNTQSKLEVNKFCKSCERIGFLQVFIDNLPNAAVLIDRSGAVLYSNQLYLDFFHLTKEAFIGINYLANEKVKDAGWLDYFNRAFSGETVVTEHSLGRIDFPDYYVTTKFIPFSDTEEQNRWIVLVHEDQTYTKNLIRDISAKEKEFEAILSSVDDLLIILDKNGNLKNCHGKMPRRFLFGCTEKKQLKHYKEFLPQSIIGKLEEFIAGTLQESNQFKITKVTDGEQRHYLVSLNNMKCNDNTSGYVIVVRDITKLENSDIALAHSEKRYKELTELLPEPVYESNAQGKMLYINKAGIDKFKLDSNYLDLNYTIFDFIKPNEHQKLIDNRIKVAFTKTLLKDEYTLVDKEGNEYQTLIYVSPQFENDEFTGIRGLVIDLKEQKEAESAILQAKESIEEMSKFKSLLLNNLNHEFRTPLSGIIGFAELLMMQLHEPNLIEQAKIIKSSGFRLLKTLNSIIQLAKIEAKMAEPNYGKIYVESILSEVIENYQILLPEKKLTFDVQINDFNLFVRGDADFIHMIFTNIIDNAVKFSSNSVISISLSHAPSDADYARLVVRDKGIGISQEMIQKVLEPFRQGSEGFSRFFQGVGLGLSLTHKMVESLEGHLQVDSHPGEGTTVTIDLPLYVDYNGGISLPIQNQTAYTTVR